MRLDAYMAKFWPEYSRSVWHKYIEMGLVEVNGEVMTSVRRHLGEDDVVTVKTLPVADFTKETLPVVYEDEHVIVINKPVGILTHAKGALTEEFSVAEFMRPRMHEPDDTNRPGIVHRLDRATSGIIICGRDSESTLYGHSKGRIKRMCLHAKELEITIPGSQRKTFAADVPSDLAAFMKEIGYVE